MSRNLVFPLFAAILTPLESHYLAATPPGSWTAEDVGTIVSANDVVIDPYETEGDEFTVDELEAIDIDSDEFWDRFYTTYRMPRECRERATVTSNGETWCLTTRCRALGTVARSGRIHKT